MYIENDGGRVFDPYGHLDAEKHEKAWELEDRIEKTKRELVRTRMSYFEAGQGRPHDVTGELIEGEKPILDYGDCRDLGVKLGVRADQVYESFVLDEPLPSGKIIQFDDFLELREPTSKRLDEKKPGSSIKDDLLKLSKEQFGDLY